MADTVTTQVLNDGERNAVLLFTNVSDGTGESAVKKVNLASLNPQPGRVKINRIRYATYGMGVRIYWEAAVNQLAYTLPENHSDDVDFGPDGGLIPPNVAGLTGNILFTTQGHTSGDSYSVELGLKKKDA